MKGNVDYKYDASRYENKKFITKNAQVKEVINQAETVVNN